MNLERRYRIFVEHLRTQMHLTGVARLLEWDQATLMPPASGEVRAEQLAILSQLAHEAAVAPAFLEVVDELYERREQLPEHWRADVCDIKWKTDRLRRVPSEFVGRRARLHAKGRSAWAEAVARNDFRVLAPVLGEVVRLERDFALRMAPGRDPYEVLLEEYEPGVELAEWKELFAEIVPASQALLRRALELPRDLAESWPGPFPKSDQRRLCVQLLKWLGFDFRTGRLDESLHPFSITVGQDHRVTTRYDESDLREALFSTLHEAGHALYEQGLDPEGYGLPRGSACSLGVHESQSRFWENQIGRSESFWQFLWPRLQEAFPTLAGMTLREAVRSVNRVCASLVRTDADEVTYNLHVALRFSLEQELLCERLCVADLPDAWREEMRHLLGIEPKDDRQGVLQDVHWASGGFGYFPTYTLGNVFAAALFAAMESDFGGLDRFVQRGEFGPLRDWLRDRVFRWGRTYPSKELMARAIGRVPGSQDLVAYLTRKLDWLEQHCH